MSSGSWEIRMSRSKGLPYFFNRDTQQSLWDKPDDLTNDDVRALPGAELLNAQPTSASSTDQRADRVRASHLLVKHFGSRRPSSWKEAKITRSKEEAIQILQGFQQEINGDTTKFAELAEKNSDCSSHSHGGDLGWFGPGMMQKAFEDATYALEVGQISDVISTDSGVHLILRTA